jgi:hypothetical protein
MQKIKGANLDIDLSKVTGMAWEPGTCPWGPEHRCAVKNTSICDNFGGIEAPDNIICNYTKEEHDN